MEKLLEALNIIKEECGKYTDCRSCPMYDPDYRECGVYATPVFWSVLE